MRKQTLLFSESCIMDNTTVALFCRAQRRSKGEEKEKGDGHPSLIRSPSLDMDSC